MVLPGKEAGTDAGSKAGQDAGKKAGQAAGEEAGKEAGLKAAADALGIPLAELLAKKSMPFATFIPIFITFGLYRWYFLFRNIILLVPLNP